MAVTREDVLRVAALARLGVPTERVDALVGELGEILRHVDVLTRLDAPVGDSASAGMPLAPDEPPSVPLSREREDFAPAMRDGFFLVPRLDTHDDGTGAA